MISNVLFRAFATSLLQDSWQDRVKLKWYFWSSIVNHSPWIEGSEWCHRRLLFSSSPSLFQRKAFYRHRIPEFSCVKEETVAIDILVTSGNGDRKIKQSIIITSRPPSRKRKWNKLNQFRRASTKVIPIEKT